MYKPYIFLAALFLCIGSASMAQKNLACAMRGLLERDTDLCNSAIAADQAVDAVLGLA